MIQDTHGHIQFNNANMIQLMATVEHVKNEFPSHLDGVLKATKVNRDFEVLLN